MEGYLLSIPLVFHHININVFDNVLLTLTPPGVLKILLGRRKFPNYSEVYNTPSLKCFREERGGEHPALGL